jgi:cytochrome c5
LAELRNFFFNICQFDNQLLRNNRMKNLTAIALSAGLVMAASTGTAIASGEDTYKAACAACHATGAAGSPKFGDKAAWAPRIAQGNDALYNSALKGKGAMPPKGGRMDMADDVIKAAVDYMVSQSK